MAIEMPLEILAGLVFIGVPAFVALTALTGGLRNEPVTPDGALARLRLDDPDVEVDATVVGADGRAALLRLSDGRTAVVAAVGDQLTSRILDESPLRSATEREDRIHLYFRDTGLPTVTIQLPDSSVRAAWLGRLGEVAVARA